MRYWQWVKKRRGLNDNNDAGIAGNNYRMLEGIVS
jgi:hypothetical protein